MRNTRTVLRPTRVRLGDHFMLSDFMGCDSVYRHGYKNVMYEDEQSKLEEGRTLVQSMLEPLIAGGSRLGISYGYISPPLSRAIVKYQDPDKPSYHRWDAGAAADAVFHNRQHQPPIKIAAEIDATLPSSRLITYSESPYICLATRVAEVEAGKPRKALYENRFRPFGGVKPLYIAYPANVAKRRDMLDRIPDDLDWVGMGYPRYHGGGRQQYHHIRTSKYTMLSDFLYSEEAVTQGIPNPPLPHVLDSCKYLGEKLDMVYEISGVPRFSILSSYENPEWSEYSEMYMEKTFYIVLGCAEQYLDSLKDALFRAIPYADIEVDTKNGEILVGGELGL